MWLNLDRLGAQALGAAMIVQFVAELLNRTVSAVAPEIATSLHFDSSFIGLYTACVYFGDCASSLVGGNFIRRYGPARICEYGLIGAAFSLLLCISDWSLIIIASGILLGLGKGVIMPALSTMVSHHTNKTHFNLVFSIKQASGPLGAALAGVLLPYMAVHHGWREALIVAAIIGAIGACWCWVIRKEQDTYLDKSEKINPKALQESFRLVAGDQNLFRLSVLSICYKGLSVTVLAYLVTYLVHRNFSLQFGGLALSCATIGILFGRVFWGWLADKINSSKIVLALCGLMMGVMTVVLAHVNDTYLSGSVLLISFFLGFSAKGWSGVFLAQVAEHAPGGRVSEATGGADFFTNLGAIFIPIFFGLLVTYLDKDYHITFYIIAASTILTGFLMFFLPGNNQQTNKKA